MKRPQPNPEYQEIGVKWKHELEQIRDSALYRLVADVRWDSVPFHNSQRNLEELRRKVLCHVPAKKVAIVVELHRVIREIAMLMCAERLAAKQNALQATKSQFRGKQNQPRAQE